MIKSNRWTTESAGWWESYWSKSEILLPSEVSTAARKRLLFAGQRRSHRDGADRQPLLSFFWHSAQYAMGSASRPGKLAPSAYGPWNTNDLPAWLGDYCMGKCSSLCVFFQPEAS